ncbi:MAG: MgtC/SapB family protein [Geminicoccaceae bacterium]
MLQIDWPLEALMAARVLYATFLGALVGLERQFHGGFAGMRTYGAVALGACAFGLVSQHVPNIPDPSRIAAQVVSGIGFIGAGLILRDRGGITGLTTAATIWAVAAVGLATAFGMYVLATLTAILILALLAAHHLPGWSRLGIHHQEERHPDPPATGK